MVGDLSGIVHRLPSPVFWSVGAVVHLTITSSIGSPGDGGGSEVDILHINIPYLWPSGQSQLRQYQHQ